MFIFLRQPLPIEQRGRSKSYQAGAQVPLESSESILGLPRPKAHVASRSAPKLVQISRRLL